MDMEANMWTLLSSLGNWAMSVSATFGAWVTAASTGAIAAWVMNLLRELWSRPRLEIAIDLGLGSVVETSVTGENEEEIARRTYARVVVRNRGRTLAKDCCAVIDYIKRTNPAAADYVFRSDQIDLYWTLLREASTVLHVPARGYRLLDVGHTEIFENQLTAGNFHNSSFRIDGAILPNRLIPELRMNATYDMHIRTYADNAAPVEMSCRLTVGNTFRDVTFQPCDDPRPREQR
jgi:hypothetical protein